MLVKPALDCNQSSVRKFRFRKKLDISLYEVKHVVKESKKD